MKKGIKISLVILSLVLMLGAVAVASQIYGLYEVTEDVSTSIGIVNLPAGTNIGGSPTNYITLTAETTMEVVTGEAPGHESHTFSSGEKIDCTHEPPAPDPCGG